jgi:hypothetical protein
MSSSRSAVELTARWELAAAATWQAIQQQHPDLAAVPLGSGGAELVLTDTVADTADPSVPAGERALAALLHQAAHRLADQRGVRETSNRGYYHNRAYRELAEELGLNVDEAGGRGWQRTTLPPGTTQRYAPQIEQLTHALPAATGDRPSTGRTTARTSSRNYLPATCQCEPPRRIRAAAAEFARGPVVCSLCGAAFTPPTTSA